MKLSKIGEFGLIESIRAKYPDIAPGILTSIGDDAAALKIEKGITLITTDILLEGIHFDLSFTTFYQLGYKLLAVNSSDIFAMGGKPKYFLISLGLPNNFDSKDIHEFYSGIMKIARKIGVTVVGGDTCESRHDLVLGGTLIGSTDRVITRLGARDGDGIFVTSTLGDSAMGLMLLKKLGKKIPVETRNSNFKFQISNFKIGNTRLIFPLLKRHLMPQPAPLEETTNITSMIDVSDGLLIDLSHICNESKIGAIIYRDKIPISRELSATAKKLGIDPFKFALKGGEDYALLFTAPSDTKTNAVRIGEIIKKGRFLIDTRGKKIPFKAEGYEHFRRNYKGPKGARGLGFK